MKLDALSAVSHQ